MTRKKPSGHGDEPKPEDLELDDKHAEDVAGGGGDPATTGRAEIHDITITKSVDKASPKLMQ